MAKKEKAKQHVWEKDDAGEIEIFAYTSGESHNGPKCKICGFGFCHHCFPEGYKTTCPHKSLGSNDAKLFAR